MARRSTGTYGPGHDLVDAIGVQPATTFGARARVPRPVLLILVYGIFLVIVGMTAMAQTAMVSADLSTTTLNTAVGADAALVRPFVTSNLSPDDLGPAGPTPERQADARGATGIARRAGRDRCGSRSAGPTDGSWPPTTPRRVASSARRRADFTTALGRPDRDGRRSPTRG